MTWVDGAIIGILIAAAFIGSRIGVVRAVCVCASFVLATIISSRVAVVLDALIVDYIHDENLSYVISFTAIFILSLVGLSYIGNAICKVIRATPLAWFDSWIGGVMGFVSGIILVGLAVMYLIWYPVSNSDLWLNDSFLVSVIKVILSPILQEVLRKGYEVSPIA